MFPSSSESIGRYISSLIKKATEDEMLKMRETYEERLRRTDEENQAKLKRMEEEKDKKLVVPHLWNLNEDPQLTGMLTHFVPPGALSVGSGAECDIVIKGIGVLKHHVTLKNEDNEKVVLVENDGDVLVNGAAVDKEIELAHGDRIVFGNNHMYVLYHPQDASKQIRAGTLKEAELETRITYNDAQEEIALKNGGLVTMSKDTNATPGEMILREDLLKLMPIVNGANRMATELQKGVDYELVLAPPGLKGNHNGVADIWIKLHDQNSGNMYYLTREDFMDRKFEMQEIYQDFLDGMPDWNPTVEEDPFLHMADEETIIGYASVYIDGFGHLLETEADVAVQNIKGKDTAQLSVAVYPTNNGVIIDDEMLDDPSQLIGREDLGCKVVIKCLKGLPGRIKDSRVNFTFEIDEDSYSTHSTELLSGINPKFNSRFEVKLPSPITPEFVRRLQRPLVFEVYGTHKDRVLSQPEMVTKQQVSESDKLEKLQSIIDQIKTMVMMAQQKNENHIERAALENVLFEEKPKAELTRQSAVESPQPAVKKLPTPEPEPVKMVDAEKKQVEKTENHGQTATTMSPTDPASSEVIVEHVEPSSPQKSSLKSSRSSSRHSVTFAKKKTKSRMCSVS